MSSTPTTPQTTFRVLGVCGGIGAGKSTACKLLVSESSTKSSSSSTELNCLAHIDADTLAHSVYAPGSQAVQDIVNEFGSKVVLLLDNKDDDKNADDAVAAAPDRMEIDRKQLGNIVFADRNAMAKLERIVWPHVKTLIVERIENLKQEWETAAATATGDDSGKQQRKRPIVILEAAVLLDAGWDDLLDGVWIVTAPKDVALKRLMETRGLSQAEAEKRMEAQASRRGMGTTFQQEIDNGVITGVIENNSNDGLEELTASLKSALDDSTFWK
ncbi:MAG: hypothetical protein SGILL_007691 [Bacillariaceae sp.]